MPILRAVRWEQVVRARRGGGRKIVWGVLAVAWIVGCATSPKPKKKTSPFGYANTPLTSLADSMTLFAQAALSGKSLPTAPFCLAEEVPRGQPSIRDRGTLPKGQLTWLMYGMEIDFVLEKPDGGLQSVTAAALVTKRGLRLVDFRLKEGGLSGTERRGIPWQIKATVAHILSEAKAHRHERFRLRVEDLPHFAEPISTKLVRQARKSELGKLVGVTQHSGKLVSYRLDDIGLFAADESGKVFVIRMDLDQGAQPQEGYVLDASPMLVVSELGF